MCVLAVATSECMGRARDEDSARYASHAASAGKACGERGRYELDIDSSGTAARVQGAY